MEQQSTETLFELKNVSFNSEDFEILSEVSVSIPKKQSTIILGSSGCGKSTLLKIIAGIYPPDSGKVILNSRELKDYSYKEMLEFRKKIGFVFQDAALWENTSIFENIALPLRFHYYRLGKAEIEKKVMKLVDSVGFTDPVHLRPSSLSFGEMKVISFLRAIITDPEILFIDDALQSMDIQFTAKFIDMFRQMKNRGVTIIGISHNAQLVSQIADRLVIMHKGKVVADGEFNEIKKSSDPYIREILSMILGEAASYDTDLLDLLNG